MATIGDVLFFYVGSRDTISPAVKLPALYAGGPVSQRVRVVEVIDGNTFKTEAYTVRLQGVEAPTLSQPGGLEARRWLEWLLETGKVVTIEEKATDTEGRIIAQVWINSTDVNGTMRDFLSR